VDYYLDIGYMYVKITVATDTESETKTASESKVKQISEFMFTSHKKFDLSPRLKFGIGRGYSQNQMLKYGAGICLFTALLLTANAIRIIASRSNSPALAPQVLGASDTRTENDVPAVELIEYKVQKGDTLFDISQKYNIDWTTVVTLNNLQSPFTLKAGQIIKIPK